MQSPVKKCVGLTIPWVQRSGLEHLPRSDEKDRFPIINPVYRDYLGSSHWPKADEKYTFPIINSVYRIGSRFSKSVADMGSRFCRYR